VPIEQIETGDTVLTHLPDGSPYTFVVEIKRFDIDKAAGTATVELQAARETDMETISGRRSRTSGLSVQQIACRRGYAETVSFTHALTRWHGGAPGRYRRSQSPESR
jgi:AraC-like DNA-binding protein